MQFFSLFILFTTAIVSITSTKKQIFLQQTKTVYIQVDQIYEQVIPQFFEMYQAAQLVNFTKYNQPITNQQQPCKIQQVKPSEYIPNNIFYHYKLADPERYFLGRKKIFNFEDLSKLTGIIDVIEFNSQVITLFQNGFYSFSSVDSTGKISVNEIKLLYDQTENLHQSNYGAHVYKTVINYGNLLKNQQDKQHLIFFGQDQVLIMNSTTKVFEDVAGYEPIGMNFEKAIIVGDMIYVGAGKQGVHVYQIDLKKKAIILTQKINPYIKYNNNIKVALQVSDLLWDPVNNQLLLNDEQQGLHWLTIPTTSIQQQTQVIQSTILLQRCSNLQLVQQQKTAIATCPQLLIINLTSKSHSIIDEIQFNPQTVLINQSRIMVFGEYRYAVYDMETDLVQTGESSVKIDFAAIKDNWIVIVNMFSISTGEIHPEQQKITCFVDSSSSAQPLGQITANLSIEGICSQLYSTPMLCGNVSSSLFYPSPQDLSRITANINQQQNCELIYSVNFQVVNSSIISYMWQIIAGVIITWILCAGMIIYCVKDIKLKKQYEQLQQQTNSARNKLQEQTKSQLFSGK